MTGEKKSSDLASRLSVKGSKKLLSKSPKPASSAVSCPPKAAIATSNARKEEAHRRRNPLNDILRRKSGDGLPVERDTSPPFQDVELGKAPQPGIVAEEADVRVADRVAELERALAIAKERQDDLRDELEKVKEQRQLDGETINDLKDEVARAQLNAGNDTSTARERQQSSEPPVTIVVSQHELLNQNYDLRYKLAHLQDQLVSQDITYRNNLDRALSRGDAEWNDLRSRLHATEKESQERLQQLLSLKSSISSLTRSDSQVTDSELAESFDQLANRIREWVISNFRRAKFDVGDLPFEAVKALRSLTPGYEVIESTDRLALYQAIVSSALMQIFEEPIALGLPKMGPLSAIRSFAESVKDSGSEYREWRRATFRVIEGSKAVDALQQGKSDFLHQIAGEIAHLLFTLTSVSLTPNAQSALMGVLNVAAGLQRTLALQKARYQVLFTRNPEGSRDSCFDDQRMESINDLDVIVDEGDVSMERQFLFCVFPCLEKFGDEWGENLEVSNVLLKARVCCGVG